MALIRSLGNSTGGAAYNTAAVPFIREALAYAGFTDLSVTDANDVVSIHTGSTPASDSTFVELTAEGGDGFLDAYASASVHLKRSWGLYITIVATKSAIALLSKAAASAPSYCGCVITKDNTGNYVLVQQADGSRWDLYTLNNPAIMPRNALYTAITKYGATTSTAFGSTALSKMPVPTYDGNAKYLPSVAFAHATQYQIDGSVLLNGTQKFYCIGGSWFLDDSEGGQT
jgi:hypothetical protein